MAWQSRAKLEVFVVCTLLVAALLVTYNILFEMEYPENSKERDINTPLLFVTPTTKIAVTINKTTAREIRMNATTNMTTFGTPIATTTTENVPKLNSFLGEKLIHIDLKGAPPHIAYLVKLFPYFRGLGATGLLVEYEDMFPYSDKLDRAENAYSLSDVEKLIESAYDHDLSVIPLIQTFGHMEFLLKLEKFVDYREVPTNPQVICPTHENTSVLIRTMIDEVMKVHPKIRHIHIGCDEVFHVGKCQKCIDAKNENDWNNSDLLLNHIKTIARYINDTYPHVRPIIWGDMVKRVSSKALFKHEIPSLVDVMIWHYSPFITEYLTPDYFTTLQKTFHCVWIAGAFKGATGSDKIVTNSYYHLGNLRKWMDIVSKRMNKMNFKGLVLTGWQRYDHFAVLCELLPLGVPTLALELQYLNNFENGTNEVILRNILECDGPIPLSPDGSGIEVMTTICNFPGFDVYKNVLNFFLLKKKIERSYPPHSPNGWFSAYNIINNFGNPAQIEHYLHQFPIEQYRNLVNNSVSELVRSLSHIYDEFTVKEWIMTYVTPLKVRLDCLYRAHETLSERTVWSRRSLPGDSVALLTDVDSVCRKNDSCCPFLFI